MRFTVNQKQKKIEEMKQVALAGMFKTATRCSIKDGETETTTDEIDWSKVISCKWVGRSGVAMTGETSWYRLDP